MPRTPLASLLALVFWCTTSAASPGDVPPVAPNPGAWSAPVWLGHTAVHSTLLPADSSLWHSHLLTWQEEGHGADSLVHPYFGRFWGWVPPVSDSAALDYTTFRPLVEIAPQANLLCAGHAQMANGHLMIAGGHVADDTGIRTAIEFDPKTGVFQHRADMHHRRWYATTTSLLDGRVMVTSGSEFHTLRLFGGIEPSTTLPADSAVHLAALTETVEPHEDTNFSADSAGGNPGARTDHTFIDHFAFSTQILFGGRDAAGALRNDLWFFYENMLPGRIGYTHVWTRVIPAEAPPAARRRHTAVVLSDLSMIVIGGLGRSGDRDTVFDDVWRLWREDECCQWHWTKLHPTGAGPGPRYGLTAVTDLSGRRILVFGGAASPGGAPADARVWALTFTGDADDAPVWSVPTLTSEVAPKPRLGHTLTVDPLTDIADDGSTSNRAFLFGGSLGPEGTGALSGELWTLWMHPDGTLGWLPSDAGGGPAPRERHAAAMDPEIVRLIIQGGELANGAKDSTVYTLPLDAFAWRGAAAGYPARSGHTLLQDPAPLYVPEPEIFDPATDTWTDLPGASRLMDWYPFVFAVPGGVFVAGPSDTTLRLDLAGGNWRQQPATVSSGFVGGDAVMYRPGKIMKCGSRDSETGEIDAVGTTKHISLIPGDPDSLWVESMNAMRPRVTHNLVILPSGEVLAIGGCDTIADGQNLGPEKRPELWNPDYANGLGIWYGASGTVQLAADTLLRGYHSTAILLPDASVLSAGGSGDPFRQSWGRVYFPPYLFNPDGTHRVRPRITIAPRYASYGTDITIVTPDGANLDHVCLIRPGAATHGFDENERYVPLTILGTAGGLRVRLPADASWAPPGDYLLFLVDKQGTPSIASWLRLIPPQLLGVSPGGADVSLALAPPRPNPFALATTLRFQLGVSGPVRLDVYDTGGRRVRTLARGWLQAGPHEATWDGRDERGRSTAPGIYWARLSAAGTLRTQRLARLR